jgi:hypothetical protein
MGAGERQDARPEGDATGPESEGFGSEDDGQPRTLAVEVFKPTGPIWSDPLRTLIPPMASLVCPGVLAFSGPRPG